MAPTTKLYSPVDDEVETIVAEAADLRALEQIAALNLASADSSLPSHLESRFRILKSLLSRLHSLHHNQICTISSPHHQPNQSPSSPLNPLDSEPKLSLQASHRGTPAKPVVSEPKFRSPTSSRGSPAKAMDFKSKLRSPGEAGSRGTPSPPSRQTCCFGFSPRSKKTKKEKNDDGNDDEVFGEFRASFGEQQRKLKKALKEQEKMSQEAEKMARWVKQASARMKCHRD